MRQILYVSRCTEPGDQAVLDAIVHQARTSNALDGVTGLLWSDGERFAQVIEGDGAAIEDVMRRIRADSRHYDLTVVHDVAIEERQFGSWSMALRSVDEPADAFDRRMRNILGDAPDATQRAFKGLVASG